MVNKVKTINISGTSMDVHSTGCYEDKGPVYFGEMPMVYFERILITVRLTCSLPGGQWTDGLGIEPFGPRMGFK